MSVTRIFNSGRVCWQTANQNECPELPIVGHVDAGGTLVLDQEEHSIVLQPGTVNDLIRMLNMLRKDAQLTKAKG